MEDLSLTQLRYFQVVVDRGSLTRAARDLRVSQPTLTIALQNLEARLQTTLLLRSSRGVTPTAAGRLLYGEATEVLDRVRRAEALISGVEDEHIGRFTVGCYPVLGAYFLPGFLPGFIVQYPRIDISLWTGSSDQVLQAVVDRQVDFGLIVNPRPHPELVLVPLFDDEVGLFTVQAAESLRAAKAYIAAHPLLLAARVRQSEQIVIRLAEIGVVAARTLTCGEFELVKSLCAAGVGTGVLPRRVARMSSGVTGLHPDLPVIHDEICLVYRADFHRTTAASTVKDALVRYGKTLATASPPRSAG